MSSSFRNETFEYFGEIQRDLFECKLNGFETFIVQTFDQIDDMLKREREETSMRSIRGRDWSIPDVLRRFPLFDWLAYLFRHWIVRIDRVPSCSHVHIFSIPQSLDQDHVEAKHSIVHLFSIIHLQGRSLLVSLESLCICRARRGVHRYHSAVWYSRQAKQI